MIPLRRRQAPRAAATSDTTRFRGVAAAAAVAAVVATAAAIALSSRDALRGAPGPLPLPHRRAGLTCAACHQERAPIAAACTGCHGEHRSTRKPHQQLASRGLLSCADCHSGHGDNAGVVFAAGGAAVRYGPGGERRLAPAAHYRPTRDVTVPIISARACARCHDATSPRDALAACLVAGQNALGAARPTVCFDEHRPAGREVGAAAARSAAWEAAREVAAAAPLAPARSAAPPQPLLWLALAATGAALAWAGARAVHRRRAAARAAASAQLSPAASLRPPEVARLPVIDAATCLGCYACVDACPYDVLEIKRYVAEVARPADCCGLTLCEQRCPNGSLVMTDAAAAPPAGATALGDSLESRDVPGLFVAGDATGLALIRNAINQGAHAVRTIAERRRARTRLDGDLLDLVIVGAGPAGLSGALEAQALGLRYLVLEQGSVAGSIRSFPRGKLVLDPDLPTLGRLWLAETSKEELLSRWLQIVRRERPAIREGVRVTSIERVAGSFVIVAVSSNGEERTTDRAASVLLAVGRRGTPRPLPIEVPPAWSDRVHYSLADARSFAGQRVLVVGLGDVAMEAALALSRQPGTEVTVSYRGDDFNRGKARNIAELRRREAAGALRIAWRSELRALEPGRAVLDAPGGPRSLPCDAVLAFIGAIPPDSLLRAAGPQAAKTASPAGPFKAVEPALCPDGPEEART